MHLLFEEDGAFKAGTVLSGTDASFQVELPTGKRTKVKSSHVMLRFEQPTPAQLMQEATRAAEDIELDFLWECSPQQEFGFEDLAREYHGRAPTAVESAAILLRLHSAPVYFHRKSRGHYRPAPPEILKQALAAVERKRQQEAQRDAYAQQLIDGQVPAAIASQAVFLAARPDKNSIEYKAVEMAAAATHMSPLRLLLARGAIRSAYRWHLDSFLLSFFPRGTGFAAELPPPAALPQLPLAEVQAFSIDDSATTEIDDAFSVHRHAAGTRIGIHIAAPALGIQRGEALDAVARTRLSTVYAPGLKYTMLPPAWIAAYSLDEGRSVPVLSLYVDVDAELRIVSTVTRVEAVRIAANLRHDQLDGAVTEDEIARGQLDVPFGNELVFLWQFARVLLASREQARGRPEPRARIDYSVDLDFAGDTPDENARVLIRQRKRGSPLDLIVAELMILANSHWGGWLAREKVAGIYRSQSRINGQNRVRMSTVPSAHEGIGVDHYTWSTSPLRRYVDLVNQRQLIALARGEAPPYGANDAELFSVVSAFDAAYTAYADFQDRLERYWCLRWLQQNNVERATATVLKGDVLRLDGLPFVTRLPGLPELPRGQRIEIDVLGSDEVELSLHARLHQVLAAEAALEPDEEDEVSAEPAPLPAAVPTTSDAASEQAAPPAA